MPIGSIAWDAVGAPRSCAIIWHASKIGLSRMDARVLLKRPGAIERPFFRRFTSRAQTEHPFRADSPTRCRVTLQSSTCRGSE